MRVDLDDEQRARLEEALRRHGLSGTGTVQRLPRVLAPLTRRETEVLGLVADGLRNKQIADRLEITVETTKTHVRNAIAKSVADSRAHLVALRYQDGTLAATYSPHLMPELTPREHEVLTLVAQGRSNKRIAGELGLGVETVKSHVARLLRKFDARNRAELVSLSYGIAADMA